MAETVYSLKEQLRARVSRFITGDTKTRSGVREILDKLRNEKMQAVIFGGALRSLLIGNSRPRDIDLVVMGETQDELLQRFQPNFRRRTRFGGLQLSHYAWHFDLWPVESTWMLQNDPRLSPGFESLPNTTFFNLEAIAIEVWPRQRGMARVIFSGDDQFFRGILNRELELNRPENPFPSLCVVRSLIMGIRLGYSFGPRLIQYLRKHGQQLTPCELEQVQLKHYGTLVERGPHLATLLKQIGEGEGKFRISERRQMALLSS